MRSWPLGGLTGSIDSVCGQLARDASAGLVRGYLAERLFGKTEMNQLEAQNNHALVQSLPPNLKQQRLQVASDLMCCPTMAPGGEPDQLRRGEAKAGTTSVHAYAAAFVLQAGRRVR